MVVVDPETQVESIRRPSTRFMRLAMSYMGLASQWGLMPSIKKYRTTKPPWYKQSLTKSERTLDYASQQELRRLKFTLEKMHKRSKLEVILTYQFR